LYLHAIPEIGVISKEHMLHPHFNLALIEVLEAHRTYSLTKLFLFFTALGGFDGYVVVIASIYVLWDKRLAVKLAILALFSMSLNHLLKIWIKNPRPFVTQGTYAKNWAVPRSDDAALVQDYSTPSGHAMSAATFYPYLLRSTNIRWIQTLAVVAPIMIGLSRPYLGVHYVEDVLIGWTIGLAIALFAVKFGGEIETVWSNLTHVQQISFAIAGSVLIALVSIPLNNWHIDIQPRTFLSYAGFLTGIVIAVPLEIKLIDFDPMSHSVLSKALRLLVTIIVVLATLQLLGAVFSLLAAKYSLLGYVFEFIRYIVAGAVGIFVAPFLFTQLKLAERRIK